MIADDPFDNVIAQSKNGSGKTGAFTIGSVLRVDPADKKPQVICICHTRELSNQIAAVYEKLIKGTDITLQNMTVTGNSNA
jgi:superfamily II DNA/RNA helicase